MPKEGVTCLFCVKTFTKCSLPNHVRVHTLEKPYFCNSCGRGFSRNGNQRTHQLIHSGRKPFQCDIGDCSKRFAQLGTLTRHKRVHFDIRKYECKFCDQSFKWKVSLTNHLKTHLFDNWYKCPLCPEKFETIPLLHPHLRTHKREDCLECPTCSNELSNGSHLLIHVYMHSMEKPEKVVRSSSESGSMSKSEGRQTERKVRRLGRSECPFCGNIFSSFADQQEHLRTDHEEPTRSYQCVFCNKNFHQSSQLGHVRSHIQERPFFCRNLHCGKSFLQSNGLKYHMTRCH